MKKILFKKINLIISDTEFNKSLILKKENLKILKSLSENEKINLIKKFDSDFYINDGYNINILKNYITYSYDNGSDEIEIFLL